MRGFDDQSTTSARLLVPSQLHQRQRSWLPLAAIVLLVIVPLWYIGSDDGTDSPSVVTTNAKASPPGWHGVSLGGWLVMEINPSTRGPDAPIDLRPFWMYDQIEAASELDFVTALREEHGDAYAVATMRNHWRSYYTPADLDVAQSLGIDAVRLPVGYWIVEAPATGGSPLDFGISADGFVTGGLNYLQEMLAELAARDMVALVDLHAHPCNSACVSNGMYCAKPLNFMRAGDNPIGDIERCGGGVYRITRAPRAGEATWDDVGVNAIGALATWLAALPAETKGAVAALQLANEPALAADAGLGGPDLAKEAAVNAFYQRAYEAARARLPTLPLVLSFIPPSDGVVSFLEQMVSEDKRRHGHEDRLWADHHYYLNFQAPCATCPYNMTWAEIHRRACGGRYIPKIGWDLYTAESAQLHLLFGEWSLAVNHDMPLDLSDNATRDELKRLFREQLEAFGATPRLRGSFFWTLRMGSGWDPRPSDGFPDGRQLPGSSASNSLPGYPYQVWSLLELAANGIAIPLDGDYTGTCDLPPSVAP